MPGTIKVRIALEVNPEGQWQAMGWTDSGSWEGTMAGFDRLDGHHVRRYWIEREVAVPAAEPETLKGEAVPA